MASSEQHLWCTADGAPAVILDAGLGGTSSGWGFVQPEVLARGGIIGPVVLAGESIAGFNVRVFASGHPERTAGLVLVDASHEDDAHEVPGMSRFVPLLSTIGVFRLLGVSFGQRVESLAPSVQRFAQATRFRAAGYQAAADEIVHMHVPKNFVYMLRSRDAARRPYVGITSNVVQRLAAHNRGESPHTSKYGPWELVVSIGFADERRALEFERYLKSGSGRAFARRHFA